MITRIFNAELDKKSESGKIYKIIGTEKQGIIDPFLSIDHFYLEKGKGFHDHPHRGNDKVTYIINGELSYEDFNGNSGVLSPGDAI